MRNYWLHRITGGENAFTYAYNLLFKHNILSIGWSDFSNESFINDALIKGSDAIDHAIDEYEYGRPRGRWSLYRFVHEMKEGDVVVVPTYGGLFSIFEITTNKVYSNETIDKSLFVDNSNKNVIYNSQSHYLYNENNQVIDLGFYRLVKSIAIDISRTDYADQALTSRMKIRQTNANINDLKESVDNAVNAFKRSKPINLKESITDKLVPEMLQIIKRLADYSKFEQLVMLYLQSLGADVSTPSKNESATEDGDADVVAIFENIKTAILVQVKKHEGATNEWAVQQIKAFKDNHQYDDEYSTLLWVVSTCDEYSKGAKLEAIDANVRLINGTEFCQMLLNTGLKGINL